MKQKKINDSKIILVMVLTLVLANDIFGQKEAKSYVLARPEKSEGIYALLRRYQLPTHRQIVDIFSDLNADKLKNRKHLDVNQTYRMPILKYQFDGISIRSTLGIDDASLARRIEDYNAAVYRSGVQKQLYYPSGIVWVPYHELFYQKPDQETPTLYFGSPYQEIQVIDARLKGYVYYLVSGHGGPDPGAIGIRDNKKMYEDEYAYDITLRLARRLLEHQATVYMIVQDPNDGIRDDPFLSGDKDEHYLGRKTISLDKGERLRKSTEIINRLYETHKNTALRQNVIVIHCDSRPTRKRIDIFFYHKRGSKTGKRLAKLLYHTIHEKYHANQPGRGYQGVVTTRNLHMLNESIPTTVYIELGNIRNPKDQERFIMVNNRQAVANWLCEGLIRSIRQ